LTFKYVPVDCILRLLHPSEMADFKEQRIGVVPF
jgi:hypothetical protein